MTAVPSIQPVVYRKLTRLHRGIGLMSHLWLGDDHLLHVTSTGYTESYRRCYLREIQTMLIVHTARRTYLALTLAVLMLIVMLIIRSADGGWVAYAMMTAIFLPLLLWNHLLGTGCRVVIITAVQQEKVSSLSRLPRTRRIIAQLKPLIEAAQSDLEPAQEAATAAPRAFVETGSHLPPPLPLT